MESIPGTRRGPLGTFLLVGVLGLLPHLTGCDRGCTFDGREATARKPNLLLVVLDTVRADRVSSYGHRRPTTIQLDATAEAGVLFEQVIAPGSWTYPNHASLFTGEFPWVHGAHQIDQRSHAVRIPGGFNVSRVREDLPTLAEKFAAAGYQTVAFSSNHWLARETGLTRGFDVAQMFETDKETSAAAIERIKEQQADSPPLFLFVNLMHAHSPYYEGPRDFALPDSGFLDPEAGPGWIRPHLTSSANHRGLDLTTKAPGERLSAQVKFMRGDLEIPDKELALIGKLYDAGVRGADFSYGRVLSAWVEAFPSAIVAITSDHGESLGEHHFIGHQAVVYPEVLRVPMVIAAPGRLPAGVRVSDPVQLHDLHQALLVLADIDEQASVLLSTLEGGGGSDIAIRAKAWKNTDWAKDVGGRFASDWQLYREGDWAIVWDGQGGQFPVELYDMRGDPEMRSDLARQHPQRVKQLLAAAATAFEEERTTEPAELSEELRKKLEALGYVEP